MNKLLNVNEKGLASARGLHEFLGVRSKYADWIKNRINKFEFIENTDFVSVSKILENGGKEYDHAITVEMAKELSMVENNEKGKQARKYFIQCEKTLKENVQAPRQLTALEQLQLQNQAILEVNDKVSGLDSRLEGLENRMTIETGKQNILRILVNKKVSAILGGNDSPAYKELSKKAFSKCWNDFKNIMQVASYKDTPIKEFELAKKVIIDWQPNRELELMIKGCNAQLRM